MALVFIPSNQKSNLEQELGCREYNEKTSDYQH